MKYDLFINSFNSDGKQQNTVTSQNQVPSTFDNNRNSEKFSSNNLPVPTSSHFDWYDNQMNFRNEILLDIRDYLACPIIFVFIALIILFIWIIFLTIKIY
jgi:hypothetical protein